MKMQYFLPRKLSTATLICSVILPLIWLVFILTYASDYMPFGDQWDTPLRHIIHLVDGSFSIGELFSQHNESRKVIPSSLSLIGFLIVGYWSLKLEMIFGIALGFFKAILTALLVVRSQGIPRQYQKLVFCLILGLSVLLNFGRSTYLFQVWSVTLERTIVDICFVLSLFVLLRMKGTSWRIFLLIITPFIACGSYASGLVMIPLASGLAIFLAWKSLFTWRHVGIIAFSNLSLLVLYFWGYQSNPGHSSIREILVKPLPEIVSFIFAFLGNFNPFASDIPELEAIIKGGLLVLIFSVLLIWSLSRSNQRLEIGELDSLGLCMFGYSFMLAVMACISRLPMGMGHAIRDDYSIHPNFAIIGLFLVLLHLLFKSGYIVQFCIRSFTAIFCILLVTTSILVVEDFQNREIDMLNRISLLDSCQEDLEAIKSSQCFQENSPFHPLFFERFMQAEEYKILPPHKSL